MGDFNDAIEKARAYIIHDPEMGDYLSWSEQAALNSEHGFTCLFIRPEPDRSEARERIAADFAKMFPAVLAQYSQFKIVDWFIAAGLVPDEAAIRAPTSEMLLAGARSIGNTMGKPNFTQRAKACWEAMWNAREGVMENKPVAAIRNAGRNAT